MKTVRIGVVALCLFTLVPLLKAQDTTASILGRVTDQTGAVIPGAQITVMNTATGQRITLQATFGLLRELTGYQGEAAYEPSRAGDIRDSLADIGLAGELLGYQPLVDFREGLRRTVEWYKTFVATA